MSPNRCSFCQHANPADARYCNECGGSLDLRPCDRCGAVNDRRATQCEVCGAAFADASTSRSATTNPARASSAPPSIERALETVEADLASVAKSAASHNTHPLLVAALLIAVAAGIFRGDEQASSLDTTPTVSLAGATLVADTAGSSRVNEQRTSDVPTLRAATRSPRAISGAIEYAPASTFAGDMQQEAATQDAATTASIATLQPSTEPVVAPPAVAETASVDTFGTARPSTPRAVARRTRPPARGQRTASDDNALLALPRAPLWSDEHRSVSEAPSYPATRCTPGVAALGLCGRDGIAQ